MGAVILMVVFLTVSIGIRLVYMRLERGAPGCFPLFRFSGYCSPGLIVIRALTFSCLGVVLVLLLLQYIER